ncbi:hypothetical protein OPT61_g3742 [Boeremia exigua]|uniref:Uncharacterized protein n=1 Tax=Boeremia exigua TaxID=749465 RepID=A0ACC2IGU1_9PLEO|nr:hypothetical protein OPT61_g3742 [Boeremia exigua]
MEAFDGRTNCSLARRWYCPAPIAHIVQVRRLDDQGNSAIGEGTSGSSGEECLVESGTLRSVVIFLSPVTRWLEDKEVVWMFTPVETSIGAVLLHQATSNLLYQNGNILGLSGLLRRVMNAPTVEVVALFTGMAVSFPVLGSLTPELMTRYPSMPITAQTVLFTTGVAALSGWGTKTSNGCTSGHMLCGLARRSGRSAVATATFFTVAVITHHLVHPSLYTDACPGNMPCYTPVFPSASTTISLTLLAGSAILAARIIPHFIAEAAATPVANAKMSSKFQHVARTATQFFSGLLFALGLHISGMAHPAKVASFLSFPVMHAWDPSLALVVVFGVLPNLITIRRKGFAEPPAFAPGFELPTKTIKDVDVKFVAGAAAFGVAWGLSGTCPGPAVLRALAQPVWGLMWLGLIHGILHVALSYVGGDDIFFRSKPRAQPRTITKPYALNTPPLPNHHTDMTKNCVICGGEEASGEQLVRAPCRRHWVCTDDVASFFERATETESLYPPKCCGQLFSLDAYEAYVPFEISWAFQMKEHGEYSVSAKYRVYCANPTCSMFLSPALHDTDRSSKITYAVCQDEACGKLTCTTCKTLIDAVESHTCDADDDYKKFKQTATEKGFQECPNCASTVELAEACNHITCECGTQFCYVCGDQWEGMHGCPHYGRAIYDEDGYNQDGFHRTTGLNLEGRTRVEQMQIDRGDDEVEDEEDGEDGEDGENEEEDDEAFEAVMQHVDPEMREAYEALDPAERETFLLNLQIQLFEEHGITFAHPEDDERGNIAGDHEEDDDDDSEADDEGRDNTAGQDMDDEGADEARQSNNPEQNWGNNHNDPAVMNMEQGIINETPEAATSETRRVVEGPTEGSSSETSPDPWTALSVHPNEDPRDPDEVASARAVQNFEGAVELQDNIYQYLRSLSQAYAASTPERATVHHVNAVERLLSETMHDDERDPGLTHILHQIWTDVDKELVPLNIVDGALDVMQTNSQVKNTVLLFRQRLSSLTGNEYSEDDESSLTTIPDEDRPGTPMEIDSVDEQKNIEREPWQGPIGGSEDVDLDGRSYNLKSSFKDDMAYGTGRAIGVVTGANKGVGLAIVRQLALQYPRSPLNNGPLLIYLTARDKGRGEAALEQLSEDSQLKQAKALKADGGLAEIKYHHLDITDESSVTDFAKYLQESHTEGIDFVINNAGIALDGFNSNIVKQTLHTNYYNTLLASRTFLPLLKPTGRLVNVASISGALSKYSDGVCARFRAAQSEEDVSAIMRDFAAAVEQGREKDAGFPSAAYAVSKAGCIAGTKVLARLESESGGRKLVNACCPGYVNTDMTKGNGTKTPDQGALTPVLLAIQDVGGRSGEFWRDEKVVEW